MDNFINKTKFIVGKEALAKIPYELDRYTCSHAIVITENNKDEKRIKKNIIKYLKDSALKIDYICIENLYKENSDLNLIDNIILKNKKKGLIVIGNTDFVNKINVAKIKITQGRENDFESKEINIIPLIMIPYKECDLGFASKNIFIKEDKKIIKCNCLKNTIVIIDEIMYKNIIDIMNPNYYKYLCAIYKSLAATVNNTNILAMPANKAVIIELIECLINIYIGKDTELYLMKAEKALIFLNLGEENYKYNGLSQILELLIEDKNLFYKVYIEAAKIYLNYYKEYEILNNLLESVIKKYNIKNANENKLEALINFTDDITKKLNIKSYCDSFASKEDIIKAKDFVLQECCSDKQTLDNAYNAIIEMSNNNAY